MDIHKPKQSSALTVEKGSAVGKLGESLITGTRYTVLMHLFFTENTLSSYCLFSNPDPVTDQILSRINEICGIWVINAKMSTKREKFEKIHVLKICSCPEFLGSLKSV